MPKAEKPAAKTSLKTLMDRNADLMREFHVKSRKDLINVLGDLYDHKERESLLERLSHEDRDYIREFFLKNCPAGVDRSPACIKVTMEWSGNRVWIPKDEDCLTEMKAEFDRIKRQVKYNCKTKMGGRISISATIDEAFEEEFFNRASTTWFQNPHEAKGSYAFDMDYLAVKCTFGNRETRTFEGNIPNDPFSWLYDTGRELFFQLIKMLC